MIFVSLLNRVAQNPDRSPRVGRTGTEETTPLFELDRVGG